MLQPDSRERKALGVLFCKDSKNRASNVFEINAQIYGYLS